MSLKLIVNEPTLWETLNEELDRRIVVAQKSLEQAEDHEVYRYQGEIRNLRKLKGLRDYVNGLK